MTCQLDQTKSKNAIDLLLQKPERKTVSLFNRSVEADVLTTTSLREASFYLSEDHLYITHDCRLVFIEGQKALEITLKDVAKKFLIKSYRAFHRKNYKVDIKEYFKQYRILEETYLRLTSNSEEVVI
jgi:hypothetical protein